ncbi:VOC family protein [Tautonia rosea]|uniref:VOC family protein n=1 Tax=Tautonia rosea TaxID=2728037 RepID=UPI00147298A5|nr:hypothetical protein [Tautonia rosea]
MSTGTMQAPTASRKAVALTDRPRSTFRRMTPVFLVDRIEPCLDFWVDRLGFEVTLQIPGEDGLDFVRVSRDEAEVFYRTRASVESQSPGIVESSDHSPWVILSMLVSDLDELLPRLKGLEIVVPQRESDFGVRELYVREPSGRVVALVEQAFD